MTNYSAERLGLLLIALLLTIPGCSGTAKEEKGKGEGIVVKGVTLQLLAAEQLQDHLEAVGTVRARNASLIAARIPGTVKAIHVREGERVGKGKLLITLDAVESTSGAAGAQAGVEEARRGVEEARSRKQLSDVTLERYQKLFQEQAVTRQELDSRRSEQEVGTQGLARAEARLQQAVEVAKAAGATSGYSRITAPLSGIVTSKSVDQGMTVFPGSPLLTVEEEGNYRLEAAVAESMLGKVRPADRVTVVVDGVTGELQGRVVEVVPTADPASRTFLVKIDITAKGLRSGTYGRALFPVGSRTGLLVPKGAIVERGALTSVWVVDKERSARLRLVKTGKETNGKVEILAGLSSGESVVTVGLDKVVEGARIE